MPHSVRYPRSILARWILDEILTAERLPSELPIGYVDYASARNRWTHSLLPDMTVARCTWKGDGPEPDACYALRSGVARLYVIITLP
jgi:hypothetical protein